MRRKFAPKSFEAADIAAGKVEPHYLKVLSRVLAAHAIAEKLIAEGYARALNTLSDPALCAGAEKNLSRQRKRAALVFAALAELGISQSIAERSMIAALRAPSFEAPRYFAERAAGELDLLMASLSLDTAGLMMIAENYRESSYAPHSRAAELILEQEADPDAFAVGQLRFAFERFGQRKANAALREWLPRAANFFGPPGSGFTYDCITYGLKTRDNQELAELYLEMLARRIEQSGLKMPRLSSGYPRALL